MYVGRIVTVGKTNRPFVAYRVSARSYPNRMARLTNGSVAIQPLDPEDMKKNPYIAYTCLRVSDKGIVVSNGSHTDPIFEQIEQGIQPDVALQQVLTQMGYEKDEFNTPRIAGVVTNTTGFLGIVRVDGVEVSSFGLEDTACNVICTYEMDHIESKSYPFVADSALEAAKYIIDGGTFKDLENPICSAAWMGELAVCNPHE